ncbi:hypothetical protein VSR01_10775 [Actinacidiphila sp. DG2A-62]|uniref:hypothetical protein n=1 Tax=Actinacidiphila sp. DG2A-62 TaxID=3108821 RepID=UPI002DBF26DF|nr:hypothetical protein [Actinacidiphila sp. DG2A-62]MEC3994002.1 hypothetical protein [Actinacidiphila sp. DG2A-62]
MGFVPKKKTYTLDFSGTEFAGLEITVNDMTTDELISMPDAATHESLVKAFAGQLVSWNIESEDGTPVQPTPANVLTLDRSLNKVIVERWLDALNGVDAPLQPGSPSGGPSPAVTIPMEPLSGPQPNTSEPA